MPEKVADVKADIKLIPSNGEGLFTETICSPDASINSDIINISESHR